MINYRSYWIVQKGTNSFLILDQDKMPVDIQTTLSKSKHLIDVILDSTVSSTTIEDINELENLC